MMKEVRRERDRIRTEIADEVADYREERARERRIRRCGTLAADRAVLWLMCAAVSAKELRERACGTVICDIPGQWTYAILAASGGIDRLGTRLGPLALLC